MNKLSHIETISEMIHDLGIGDVHNPLIDVIDMQQATERNKFDERRMSFGFYMVVYKKSYCGNLKYGQNIYDYSDGTLIFIAPYQTIDIKGLTQTNPKGCILMFHPELLHGTFLDKNMKRYSFFGYYMNEALHVSDNELELLLNRIGYIKEELSYDAERQNPKTLVSSLSSLLNLCLQLYERQFDTRKKLCNDIVSRFEQIILEYYSDNTSSIKELPSMKYMSERLFLSPNYLGDLIKNATGRSAKDYINRLMIEETKKRLSSTDIPINEIAYSLGFEYPQYFSQMFKKNVGMTPKQYRESKMQQNRNTYKNQ